MFINEPEIAGFADKTVLKTWGVEYHIVNNERYCLKFLKVNPGFQCSIHAHHKKDETFIGLIGTLQLFLHDPNGDVSQVVGIYPGKTWRISPKQFHSFRAYHVSWIMEVSTHHSDSDVVRLQESKKVTA